MSEAKQKYLVLKVERLDEKNELYKNIYRVTDETGKLDLLGYYDEKETQPVVLLTNKSVLEYDWEGIAARVQKLNKGYCDRFVDKSKVIVITDEIKSEEVGQNFRIIGNVLFITEHRYVSQFKEENTVVEKPAVETVEEKPGFFSKLKKTLFPVRIKQKTQEEQYKTFVGDLTEDEKFASNHIWLGVVLVVILSIGFIGLNYWYDHKNKNHFYVDEDFLEQITQTKVKTVLDSIKIDTIMIPDTITLNTTFELTKEQQRIADSLAAEKRYSDSVNMYLRLNRKVKVSLHSTINDGHTERTAKTEMVADSLRDKDIAQLTAVINQMTREMNDERLEELKQNKFISPGSESKYILGMSKDEQ